MTTIPEQIKSVRNRLAIIEYGYYTMDKEDVKQSISHGLEHIDNSLNLLAELAADPTHTATSEHKTPETWRAVNHKVLGPLGETVATCNDYISPDGIRRALPRARLFAAAPVLQAELSKSNDALYAAYVWIARNCKDIEGAAVIGAMLRVQHPANVAALAKAEGK
jgi:hypothetical protein